MWINDHLKSFKQLFSNAILPKQHYMIHFPKIITQFGPPIRYSCMRFEAKHRYFKRLATKQNFLNLSKSLASRYQNDECLSQNSDECQNHPLFASELIVGPPKALSIPDLEHVKRQLITFLGVDPSGYIMAYNCRHVTVCGTKYMVDNSYLLVETVDSQPQFGVLKKIYILNSSELFFEIEMLEVLYFSEDLQAYHVQKPDVAQGYHFCRQTALLDHSCYGMVYVEGDMFIPIEYDISDLIDLHDAKMGHPA
jgi:hypothetical protein